MRFPLVPTVLLLSSAAACVALILVMVLRRPRADRTSLTPLVEAQSLRIDRLADALNRQARDEGDLRGDLSRTREVLESLRARTEERQRAEEDGWQAIRRLEAVLLGSATRGRAGENLLHEALSSLPPGMVIRDFQVNGKRVEFALVVPDGRRLPIDSKWAALREIETLEEEDDPVAREAAARRVEEEISRRAREVASYLDASLTTPFAVACVPDAAYAACRRAHADAFSRGVVLVPYSTALPVLLSLFALAARYGGAGDGRECLAELETLLDSVEQTLENKVARAATMLTNAADELRTQVGRARGAVARGRGITSGPGAALDQPAERLKLSSL
ncbi:MAG TPA: DNA recombination protein RmuC [Actinomycetota bacterium]|nr:DNA recombination protein RmuC [Actinomycetota bacterium]